MGSGDVTPANAEDRYEVERLARTVQAVTGDAIERTWVDQGCTGQRVANAVARYGIALEVVKLPGAKRGFVLLPRRWVVKRSFAERPASGLARDYERYTETVAGLHVVAFACLIMKQAAALAAGLTCCPFSVPLWAKIPVMGKRSER